MDCPPGRVAGRREDLHVGGLVLQRVAERALEQGRDVVAVESEAADLPSIIQEMLLATGSERQGRSIDKGQGASMEQKKREGYF